MIIYVENKAFPHRTFITLVNPYDKVARIRAQLLHILYEIGREDHQFRLRYKGQFLRDAFLIEEYGIVENSVVKMIPMSKKHDSLVDMRSISSSATMNTDLGPGHRADVKAALFKEINHFCLREKLLKNFQGLLYMHFLTTCLTLLTNYWYAFSWTAAVFVFSLIFSPNYTRIGGYVGNYTHLRFIFAIVCGLANLAIMGAALYFAASTWISVINHGCTNWEFVDDCSHQNVFSAIFYSFESLLLLASAIICGILLYSFKFEMGDFIEQYLVKERDIEQVMKDARSGRLKEKRTAAYELAAMAASGDDNKFRIVAENGLDVLLALALCNDESTQEHSIEAINELLTIPSIQDTLVDMGGVRTLTALLHSENARIMQEASIAIYTIVSESEDNKSAVVADHGLDDLAHAANQGTIYCQRTIASIFLELSFNKDIRALITSRNIPAQSMINLCRSNDPDTQRYALQTLELLAIESSEMICAQEDLLEILLDLPLKTMDEKLYLLAGKILLYYAENPQTCEMLMEHSSVKESLSMFARTQDPVLQKVVAKVIFCTLDTRKMKMRARELRLDRVLIYIRDNAADRDAWDMADQGLQVINSDEDNLSTLPTLSTLEKLNKMDDKGRFGSRTSLGSIDKPSGGSLSSEDFKKGIH